jgi:hypothetical protein
MLVTVDELVDYMDIKLSNRQKRAAGYVLDGLQSELEGFLRRPVEVTEFTEDYVISSENVGLPLDSFFYDYHLDTTQEYSGVFQPPITVYLRNSPVASVETVYVTNPSSGASVTAEFGRDYIVRRFGIELFVGFPNDKVTISYTAGLDGDAIKIFKLLILRAATREIQNMHDDTVGVKDLTTRNVAPLITGFTDEERKSIRRWRRVRVA